MIKTNVRGKIIEGTYAPDGEILIVPNWSANTSGFCIYICPNPKKVDKEGFPEVFDDWFENFEGVKGQFDYEGWKVKWDKPGKKISWLN